MSKLKVGDKVKCIKATYIEDGNKVAVGDIVTVDYIYEDRGGQLSFTALENKDKAINGREGNYYMSIDRFELIIKGVTMKQEERKYIVINHTSDSTGTSNLLSKKEAMDYCTSGHTIIDISKAPRYKKVTTSRMVEDKPKKTTKKKGENYE